MKSLNYVIAALIMLTCLACDNDEITPVNTGTDVVSDGQTNNDLSTEQIQLRMMAKVSSEVQSIVIWVTGDNMKQICKQFSINDTIVLSVSAGKRVFRTLALDKDGNLVFTAEKEQNIEVNVLNTVDILTEDLLKPFTVTAAQPALGTISLNWNSSLSNASYLVSWNEEGKNPILETPILKTSWSKSNLIHGKTYYFSVGVEGNESCQSVFSKRMLVSLPPLEVPTNLKAVGSDQKISLTWDSAYRDASYTLYWNTAGKVSKSDSAISGITQKLYEHEGLVNGTSYCYKVSQTVSGIESGLSDEICAAPVAPKQFSIVVSDCGFLFDDQFELLFNNASCQNEIGGTKECLFNMAPAGTHNLNVVFKSRSSLDTTDPGTLCLEIKSDSASFVKGSGPGEMGEKKVKYYFPPDIGKSQTWMIDFK